MSFIYLASPYNHADEAVMEDRYRAAVHATNYLMQQGKVVYSPIVHNHAVAKLGDLPRTWEFWRVQDLAMLRKADELLILRIDGWAASVGVAAEKAAAEAVGIPWRYL